MSGQPGFEARVGLAKPDVLRLRAPQKYDSLGLPGSHRILLGIRASGYTRSYLGSNDTRRAGPKCQITCDLPQSKATTNTA